MIFAPLHIISCYTFLRNTAPSRHLRPPVRPRPSSTRPPFRGVRPGPGCAGISFLVLQCFVTEAGKSGDADEGQRPEKVAGAVGVLAPGEDEGHDRDRGQELLKGFRFHCVCDVKGLLLSSFPRF